MMPAVRARVIFPECSLIFRTKSQLLSKMKAALITTLLAIVSFTLVSAQEPQRCAAPPSWHARVVEVSLSNRFELRGRIYYDQNEQRVAIKEEIQLGEERDFYEDYAFFKQRLRYQYNVKTKQCIKTSLNETFRPLAIPPGAKFVDRLEIGSNALAGAGVDVNIWEGDTEDGGHVVSVWTVEGCVPVSDRYFSQKTGFIVSNFYDVELGFNPYDFIPPPGCQ